MKAPLYSIKGKKTEDVELNAELYSARVNERLLQLVQNAYSANLRHGTASTKTRKEVRGGGKKPWKQKGTGRARASTIRSPLWRGGGTTFGPKPRDYFVALPSTMRKSALISALSQKAATERLMLVETLALEVPKTKEFAGIMSALPLNNRKTLCVVKELQPNVKRASNNVRHQIEIRKASDINAFHVLQRENLLIEKDALEIIEQRLINNKAPEKKTAAKGK